MKDLIKIKAVRKPDCLPFERFKSSPFIVMTDISCSILLFHINLVLILFENYSLTNSSSSSIIRSASHLDKPRSLQCSIKLAVWLNINWYTISKSSICIIKSPPNLKECCCICRLSPFL